MVNFFRWPKEFLNQRCHNCGAPGALNAHFDVPPPALICDDCLSKYRLICDFCTAPCDWEYPCRNFALPQYNYRAVDNWLTCERCAQLIVADDYPALETLAMQRMFNKGIIDRDFIEQGRAFVRALHGGFRKHRTGEPWRVDRDGKRAAFII